ARRDVAEVVDGRVLADLEVLGMADSRIRRNDGLQRDPRYRIRRIVIAAFSRTAIVICPHSSRLNAIHACATLSRMMQTKTIASTTSHPRGHRRVRRN